jgi:hypothetical protein
MTNPEVPVALTTASLTRRNGLQGALAALLGGLAPAATADAALGAGRQSAPDEERRCPPACRGQLGCTGKLCVCQKEAGCEIRRKQLTHKTPVLIPLYSNAWDAGNDRLLVTNSLGLRACNQNLGTLWSVDSWVPAPGWQTVFLSVGAVTGDQIAVNVIQSDGCAPESRLMIVDDQRLLNNQPPIWQTDPYSLLFGGIEYNPTNGLIYASVLEGAPGVFIFDPKKTGADSLVRVWDGANGTPAFVNALGMTVDAAGLIYVTGMLVDGQIGAFCYRPDGRFVRAYGVGEFGMPAAICVGADGLVYVADPMLGRVHVFDNDGRPRALLGRGSRMETAGGLGGVIGVAVNPRNHLYTVNLATFQSQPVVAFGGSDAAVCTMAPDSEAETIEVMMKRFVLPGWSGNSTR